MVLTHHPPLSHFTFLSIVRDLVAWLKKSGGQQRHAQFDAAIKVARITVTRYSTTLRAHLGFVFAYDAFSQGRVSGALVLQQIWEAGSSVSLR
jgi:hypothetical protein